jgi:hypothetical protein
MVANAVTCVTGMSVNMTQYTETTSRRLPVFEFIVIVDRSIQDIPERDSNALFTRENSFLIASRLLNEVLCSRLPDGRNLERMRQVSWFKLMCQGELLEGKESDVAFS